LIKVRKIRFPAIEAKHWMRGEFFYLIILGRDGEE
jgi:hypothetical protein